MTNALSVIPAELLARWREHAKKRNLSKLCDIIDFRDFLLENDHNGTPIGLIYKEAAAAMGYSDNTLQRNVRIIRSYPSEQLLKWIHAGLSFDHLEMANFYQDEKKPAAWLLDKAIDPGNADGSIMTVDELILFANSEKKYTEIFIRAKNMWTRLVDLIGNSPKPLWEPDKVLRYNEWREAGKEFFSECS
jgi:hypothetical protein